MRSKTISADNWLDVVLTFGVVRGVQGEELMLFVSEDEDDQGLLLCCCRREEDGQTRSCSLTQITSSLVLRLSGRLSGRLSAFSSLFGMKWKTKSDETK